MAFHPSWVVTSLLCAPEPLLLWGKIQAVTGLWPRSLSVIYVEPFLGRTRELEAGARVQGPALIRWLSAPRAAALYSLPGSSQSFVTACQRWRFGSVGVWGAAFGTAHGADSFIRSGTLLLKEKLSFPALIPICRVSLKLTGDFPSIGSINYARFLSGIAPFPFPISCCHIVQTASATENTWWVTGPAEGQLSDIKYSESILIVRRLNSVWLTEKDEAGVVWM